MSLFAVKRRERKRKLVMMEIRHSGSELSCFVVKRKKDGEI